jgi:PAS domain S-box-containing protein
MANFRQAYRKKRELQIGLLKAIHELGPLNRSKEFCRYREQYLDLIFSVLATAGIYFVLGWQLLDYLTGRPNLDTLLIVRVVFAGIFIITYTIYLFTYGKIPVRYFILAGFYAGAIFSPFISDMTGGLESPYYIDLVFLLIAWFMMIPFSYRKLAVHGLIFITIYSVILFLMVPHPVDWLQIAEHAFIFSGIYIMGIIVAIFNNLFSASAYRSEQKIKKSEERFRMFTQNSLDVVWTMNMSTRCFTYLSPSVFNLRGFHPEELIGQPVIASLTPASAERVEVMLNNAISEFKSGKRENVMIGEMEQYTRDGKTVWIEVIASFITDEAGNMVEMMGDSRNITERKLAEQKLLNIQAQLQKESQMLQQENLRIQYESLKNQVNPHFLFNSLNVLTSLIKLDPTLAEKFTEQLAKVYRYVLEHREEDLVTLRAEVEFIASYVFLLEIRFLDKVKVTIQISELRMGMKVPPLAVQLLIENAVKHNTFSRKQPLQIEIFIDDEHYLNVVNNLQKRELSIRSTGVGLVNIAARIRHLTDRPAFFGESGDRFIARIPLLNID